MTEKNLPWTEKHRPTSLDDIVGNDDIIKGLKTWVKSWSAGTPRKRAVLLVGPPGTGKTASVGALARDMDAELVEFNASDKRNKAHIEVQVWRSATQQTLDGRIRIILLDEVDGLSGTSDRGGVSAILKILTKSVHPIIMTANDPDSPRLKDLFKHCQTFSFRRISDVEVISLLRQIVKSNDSVISDDLLEEIVTRANGDLRAAISDLESLVGSNITLEEAGFGIRDISRGIEETIRRVFMTTDPVVAKRVVSQASVDYNELLMWLEENIHHHLLSPKELEMGFEALSQADLYLGRIMRGQNWKLLSYVYDFLSAGVASSRTESTFRKVEYTRPDWPLLVWKGNKKREKLGEVVAKLSSITGVSRFRTQRIRLPVIQDIITNNPKEIGLFADWLGIKKAALRLK